MKYNVNKKTHFLGTWIQLLTLLVLLATELGTHLLKVRRNMSFIKV